MALDSSTLLPISNVIDVSRIESLDPKSTEFKTFLVSLTDNVNKLLLSINDKSIGACDTNETISGKSYTVGDNQTPKPGLTKLIECGALLNNDVKHIAHGLDLNWSYSFKNIYGATSNPVGKIYLPLPHASATANEVIEVTVDATYVNIRTGIDRTAFTDTTIFLEYVE